MGNDKGSLKTITAITTACAYLQYAPRANIPHLLPAANVPANQSAHDCHHRPRQQTQNSKYRDDAP